MGGRWILVFAFTLLAACEPSRDPAAPSAESAPCRTDQDCDMPRAESQVRESFCGTAMRAGSGRSGSDITDKDAAACGPMPGMQARIPEPTLACFRGTCVSLGTLR